MAGLNHYQLLGVTSSASKQEIKNAYRALAKELHPDVAADVAAGDRFKTITNAYHTLSDDVKRKTYDWELAQQVYQYQGRVRTSPPPRAGDDNSLEGRFLRWHYEWRERTPPRTRFIAYAFAVMVPVTLLWTAGDMSFVFMNKESTFDRMAPNVKRVSKEDVSRLLAEQERPRKSAKQRPETNTTHK